jgi:hypothetical protein
MAPEVPTMRGQRALAGVMLAFVVVSSGGTIGYALAGDGRQALIALVGTGVGAVIFVADVWAIKHPKEYPYGWPSTRRSASIVLILSLIAIVLVVVIRWLL